jgi:NAD+ kinase
MKFGIFGTIYNEEVNNFVQKFINIIESYSPDIYIYEPFYKFIKNKIKFQSNNIQLFQNHSDFKNNNIDVLFSIGGDGTLLNTLPIVKDSGIPVSGINLGRLGFLATISKNEVEYAIKQIVNKNYEIDTRTTIELITSNNLFRDNNLAINEITIHKKDSASMLNINCYVDDEYLNSYWADGLIVSTPTGSTGYSLSCGGPIILPQTETLIINPIASHNLTVRPLVLPDNKVISLNVEQKNIKFMVSLDSKTMTMDSSIKLLIRKSNIKFNFIKLKEQSFYSTIRNKLMWGLDIRKIDK